MTAHGHDPSGATRALADLAFASRTRIADASRPLAWLSADELAIDLDDPQARRFGDYELVAKIGEGGMGVVYRARQHGLERDVAIKLLAAGPWASDEFIARFRREARSAARMQHPNIVEIYEFGERDGLNYFSMRLIDGESLAERLDRDGPLPGLAAAKLLRKLAEAMDYAHRLGVLHLDLKPANVLLTKDGEPLIADFGLARRIDAGHDGGGEISGTPSYMAPEQALLESHPLSASTDIYGLGATLYRMITGLPPFQADDAQATLESVVTAPLTPPAALRRDILADLEAICLKCLEKEPSQRYASARDLADDLGRFIDGRPVSVRPLSAAQRGLRWARREPRVAIAALTAFVALAVGFAVATVQWREATAAKLVAEEQRNEAVRQRELSDRRAERNDQLVALMARVYRTGGEDPDADGYVPPENEIVDWLRREMPGRDADQADILTAFVNALDAADKPAHAQNLMVPVALELGKDYRQRVADSWIARGGGRDLALAAMLLESYSTPTDDLTSRQVELLRRAVQISPDDPDVLVIAALYCDAPACREFDPQTRLANLAPDNAINWSMATTWVREDRPAVRQLLRRAAQGNQFDDYYGRLQQLTAEAIAASGVPIPEALLRPAAALSREEDPEQLIGFLQSFTMPIPVMSPFHKACDPHLSELDADMRADCLYFGRLAANQGRGLVAQMIGSAMVRRLLPGTEEAETMRELRREYLYAFAMREAMTPEQQRLAHDELQPVDSITHGELETIKRTLDRAGVPRDPPPGWEPEDPTRLMLREERDAYRAAQAR